MSSGAIRGKDFIEIFYAPSRVFTRNKDGNFWIPVGVVTVLLWIVYVAGFPLLEGTFDEAFQANAEKVLARYPGTPPAVLEAERTETVRSSFVFFPLLWAIVTLLQGCVGWVAGRAFGSRQTMRSAMMVTAFSGMPIVVSAIALLGELAFRAEGTAESVIIQGWSIARFFEPGTIPKPLSLILSIDIFGLWAAALFAIGLMVTGQLSRTRSILAVATLWLVAFIPFVVASVRS